jgi:hypothetical protein
MCHFIHYICVLPVCVDMHVSSAKSLLYVVKLLVSIVFMHILLEDMFMRLIYIINYFDGIYVHTERQLKFQPKK